MVPFKFYEQQENKVYLNEKSLDLFNAVQFCKSIPYFNFLQIQMT